MGILFENKWSLMENYFKYFILLYCLKIFCVYLHFHHFHLPFFSRIIYLFPTESVLATNKLFYFNAFFLFVIIVSNYFDLIQDKQSMPYAIIPHIQQWFLQTHGLQFNVISSQSQTLLSVINSGSWSLVLYKCLHPLYLDGEPLYFSVFLFPFFITSLRLLCNNLWSHSAIYLSFPRFTFSYLNNLSSFFFAYSFHPLSLIFATNILLNVYTTNGSWST